jgi:hypothetical protein
MSRIVTVLEAHVPAERQADLQAAYRAAADEGPPPGLVRSALMQATSDRTLWRIETLWESYEVLAEMRAQGGTPRGILIFRAAGAEPAVTVLEAVAELQSGPDDA